jgi:hypothetical protein
LSSIYDIKLNNNNNDITDVSQKPRKQLVLEGLDLILSLFVAVGQQRLFPRKIMTKHTKGQMTVYSKEQILFWFECAKYEDCRINAYPAFISEAEEQDYKQGINLNLFVPNILFIDLDIEHFNSKEELDRWLNRILKNIANVLHGAKPLVLWSGHGYHIIIPVNAKEALEQFQDFEPYTKEPSKGFLQFAARYLSLHKSDPFNNSAFKSCLLRVPFAFNSNCLEEGVDPEVKIAQQWNTSKSPPEIDNLLFEFQTFLVDVKLKAELKQEKNASDKLSHSKAQTSDRYTTVTPWIECLLQVGIDDYRKRATSLILAPYLIYKKGLACDQSAQVIREWLIDKCQPIRSLDFNPEKKIKEALFYSRQNKILHMRFDTLKQSNPGLHKLLVERMGRIMVRQQ